MRTLSLVISIAICSAFSLAATASASSKAPVVEQLTIAQLERVLSSTQTRTDSDLAQQLITFELTERISATRLAQLAAALPGEKSREALLVLADKSAFHDPPASEILPDPTPDAAATRQMLVKIVNYVNTTLRQLPNLIATRETTGFEDRPKEDALEATGIVSYSYLPLHLVGKSADAITFRDRKELIDDSLGKSKKQGHVGGMITTGEFGPILSAVLGDALKGKMIKWARWEQGAGTRLAVFNYSVPDEISNYRVKFCCLVNGFSADGQADMHLFDEQTGYHGQITFNPSDGSIVRLTLKAELPLHGLVANAGLNVEYAPFEIGAKSYLCPSKSVSTLEAHTTQPHGMYSQTNYQGPTKTYLNDMVFGHYRRFGSEARILTGENQAPQ